MFRALGIIVRTQSNATCSSRVPPSLVTGAILSPLMRRRRDLARQTGRPRARLEVHEVRFSNSPLRAEGMAPQRPQYPGPPLSARVDDDLLVRGSPIRTGAVSASRAVTARFERRTIFPWSGEVIRLPRALRRSRRSQRQFRGARFALRVDASANGDMGGCRKAILPIKGSETSQLLLRREAVVRSPM
jgi:hypothetical protein